MSAKTNESLAEQCALVSATCAQTNLRRAARVVTQHYAKSMASSGLEPTQFTLLVACAIAGTAPITVLANALAMDRTTLTRNVNLLAKQGLVRIVEGDDRRVRMVALSKKGQAALTRALPLWRQAQAELTERFGSKRLDTVLNDLSALVESAREV